MILVVIIVAFSSTLFVILSTVSFIMESFFEDYIADSDEEQIDKDVWLEILKWFDTIFLMFFSVEYFARLF